MAKKLRLSNKVGFGTFPVFITAISTILGAILFLRFGYAVANVGFAGTIAIIVLGHIITVTTAFAVAEIATNQKVEGGGAYYIISRSFGLNIGAAIGIALFLSQAISVAFYVIAFSESFSGILHQVPESISWLVNKKNIGLGTLGILSIIMLTKGANIGMQALYSVVFVLFISLILFIFGKPIEGDYEIDFFATVNFGDPFFKVFTIIFPAFTGMAAGLGLSGDLRDPKKSIPSGTLIATGVGFVVYIIIAYKLTISAPLEAMANDQHIMEKIALWGPIIPIGLACASVSSALGSVMVAPRTLQALGVDNIFPSKGVNGWFAREKGVNKEPMNSSIVTLLIAIFFVAIGDIDFVAEIISMFFMVTYGSICLISFLEHFAADPSYRPTFRSKWYLSLIGAVFSVWLMFKMNFSYAVLSMILMTVFYLLITHNSTDKTGLANLFRGVVFQLSRQLQIFLQRVDKEESEHKWRPFVICITKDSFKRRSAFDMLRWLSYKYGFGTYIHFIEGFLSEETNNESKEVLAKLINLATGSRNRVYLDTIISPSYMSAIAQVIQLSGVSGKGNNMILFEFSRTEQENLEEGLKHYDLLRSTNFDICILNTSYKGFGYKREIHVWITSQDYENASLMILLAYIILGHPEWSKGTIKIFAIYPEAQLEAQEAKLIELIKTGRLPISPNNINLIPQQNDTTTKEIISSYSIDADLTIVGFREQDINSTDFFKGFGNVGNILFVNSNKEKEIV